MTYDKNNKIIHAIGNIKARNFEMGNLRATKGDVADDFGSGKFFDSSLIFSDGSYLTSPELDRKTPEVTVLKKSIYSVCPNEEIAQNNNLAGRKLDLLSIKSRKTTIDRGADKMIINSGIIRLYNFPVFYTPYLNKSLSKERKSGFLFPTYTKNTNLGVGLIIPYYVNISPNKDLTISPYIGIGSSLRMIKSDFRHLTNYGKYDVSFEIANNKLRPRQSNAGFQQLISSKTNKQYRWNLVGKGDFDFTKNVGAGFDVNTLSDPNYLRDYRNSYFLNYTVSKANLDYINGRDYHAVRAIRIQELQVVDLKAADPLVIPRLDSYIESKPKFFKEKFALTSNLTTLSRTSGLQYRRATLVPEVNAPFNINGNLFNFGSRLQTDFYSLDNNYKHNENHANYASTQANYKPEISLSWKLPLMKKSKNNSFLIEPIISIVSSSYGKGYKAFPNEDSNSAELSISNLFVNDRVAGFDRTEVGQRINYGVRSSIFNKYGEFGLTIGQSYRKTNKTQDVQIRGFGAEKKSNLVGQAMYKANKYFSIIYSFQLNESSYKNDVNEVTTSLNFDRFTFFSNYLVIRKTPLVLNEIKQLSLGSTIKLDKKWNITINSFKDMVTGRTIQRGIILNRDGCCTVFGFSFVESNPSALVKPQKSFSFNLTFKNL